MILNDSALAQVPREIIRKRRCQRRVGAGAADGAPGRAVRGDRGSLPARAQGRRAAGGRARAEGADGRADARRAGAVRGGEADRGGARPLARRHDPVQAPPLRRLRHRRRRRDLAHRDRGAPPRHPGDRRPAPRARDDRRGRGADRRRHPGRADRQPGPAGARGIPRAPGRAQGRQEAPQAPEVHARDHASTARRSSCSPTSSCRRTCPRCSRPAPRAWACSAPSSCSSTARTCPGRTSSSRPTARWPRRWRAGRW